MRAIRVGGWLLALAAPVLMDASPAPAAGPARVVVEVAARDAAGVPVTDLTPDDFRVTLDGRPQRVAAATFIDAASPRSGATGRMVVSNTDAAAAPRVVVVAVDDLSFPPEAGRRLLAAAARLVAGLPIGAHIAVTTTSGRVILNPTEDRDLAAGTLGKVAGQYRDPRRSSVANAASISLVEAIEIVEHNNQAVIDLVRGRECGGTGRGPVGAGVYANAVANYNEACANEAMRAARAIATGTRETLDRQLAGVTRALEALAHVGGVKQVVLVSAGFATTRAASALRPAAYAAARAGARLAIVTEDVEAVDIAESGHTLNDLGAVTYTTGVSGRQNDDRAMLRSSLEALADLTGGTVDVATGAGDAAFARAARAGAAGYRLILERTGDVPKSGAMDLDVSVTRAGVFARANRVAFVDTVSGPASTGAGAVPLRLAVVRRAAPGGTRVELGVGIVGRVGADGAATITFGLVDEQGLLKQGARPVAPDASGGFALTVPMAVTPGSYGVRVTAVDAQGRAGRVDTTVDARLPVRHGLTMSDVLTWWTYANGRPQLFAMDDLPDGVSTVTAAVEFQATDGRPPVGAIAVTVSVTAAGSSQAVFTDDAAVRVTGDRVRAEANVPTGRWPSGAYLVSLRAVIDGVTVDAASAVLRKR